MKSQAPALSASASATRRRFLCFSALSPFAFLAPRARASTARPEVGRVLLLETPVAGFQYHAGMHATTGALLRPGVLLSLRREPNNRHDALALALHAPDGQRIGYVPRRKNEILARLLDGGTDLQAEVTAFDPHAPSWERARVRLFHLLVPAA